MAAKIAIVVCSHDYAPVQWACDFATMAIYSRAALDQDISLGISVVCGTYIHSARRRMLKMCIAAECTHVLWVDSDMRFPTDSLIRLLNHDKPMVGINYAKRVFPTSFTAFKTLDGAGNVHLETLPDSTGLEEVDAIGFGLLLMRMDVFKVLPPLEEDPWFGFDWRPDQNEVGEDVHFCKLVRKHGVQILVDHDLSKECGHIGTLTYRTAMVPISNKVVEDEQAAKANEQASSSAA